MKISCLHSGHAWHSRRGIALISVLAMVMLLTALVVAFMLRAGSEKQSSGFYRAEATTRDLSDTTLNLVEGEINEATTQGINYAWASQPGAIRVFDNTGAPYKTFKLYSSPSMVSATATPADVQAFLTDSNTTSDIPIPTTWYSAPGMWVDLNAPVNSDPNPSATTGLGSPSYTHFPILDPRDPALTPTNAVTTKMDGFSITGAPTDNIKIDSNGGANPAPMPVKWLYVLQNGTLTAPTSGPDASGNYSFAIAPNAANPIVGRIAFWTDDETCKVNINTAAGDGTITSSSASPPDDPTNVSSGPANGTKAGMFWSTPYYYSTDDLNLAVYQPFQGEFQRYPGHPGTVSFNNILNSLGTTIAGSLFYNNPAAGTQGITPRYTYNPPVDQVSGTVGAATPILALSSSRLYPTVSEMLFQPSRAVSVINAASTKSRQQEETARFFLTAHSRAPELNLFGLPRVSIWPISYPNYSPSSGPAPGVAPPTSTSASAVDKLIAFDSSISTNPYYFSRVAAGGDFWYIPNTSTGDESATLDVNIQRNTQLMNYLDYLTQQQLPGYGGFFGGSNSKYGAWGMRQILTEMFDYIRITDLMDSHFVNFNPSLYYTVRVGDGTTVPPLMPVPYGAPWEQPYGYGFGTAQVVPAYDNNWQTSPLGATDATTGLGTLPVLTEVTIHFVALGDDNNPILPREWLGGLEDPRSSAAPTGTDWGILHSAIPFDNTITTSYIHTGTYPVPVTSPVPQPPFDTYGEGIVPPNHVAIQAFVYLQWIFPAAWHYGQNLALNYEIGGLDGLNISTLSGDTTSITPLSNFREGYDNSTQTYQVMDGNTIAGAAKGHQLPPLNFLQFCDQVCQQIAPGQLGADHMVMDWAASQGPLGIAQSTGLYPFYGMTGSQTSNKPLAPTNPISCGNGFSAWNPTGYYFGSFPFYSSVFTVDKSVDTNLVLTASKPLVIKLYRKNIAGPAPASGDPGLFATYNVQFPSSTRLPMPTVDPSAYRIIGTQELDQGFEPNPWDGNPNNDERWWVTQEGVGTGVFIDSNIDPNTGTSYDVAKSMVLSQSYSDARMLLAGSSATAIPTAAFTPIQGFTNPGISIAHSLFTTYWQGLALVAGATPTPLVPGAPGFGLAGGYSEAPFASATINTPGPSGLGGAYTNKGAIGDWDNGMGSWPDGPWINKADEGSLPDYGGYTNYYPYFTVGNGTETNYQALFSPNKEIPSPGMFGSLPTGVPDLNGGSYPPEPWQTLLFRPGPGAAGLSPHPGEAGYQRNGSLLAGAPPDHLLLDLFWMPVAEPYAISEPFSTAGRINLNYQILPFTYIKRATALRAALASEMVARCPASDAPNYKKLTGLGLITITTTATNRLPINLDETTSQFDTKFAGWDVFHSASQICDIFLVPKGYTYSTFPAKWYDTSSKGDFALVGDNVRERPYTDMYQKVTTKSNTYTVYYRVQSLKKPAAVGVGVWNENLGAITGEYRGSTTIERFIDVNEGATTGGVFTSSIPDAAAQVAANTAPTSLEGYYKWRVVENHQFAP